jgi:hypothetical protein
VTEREKDVYPGIWHLVGPDGGSRLDLLRRDDLSWLWRSNTFVTAGTEITIQYVGYRSAYEFTASVRSEGTVFKTDPLSASASNILSRALPRVAPNNLIVSCDDNVFHVLDVTYNGIGLRLPKVHGLRVGATAILHLHRDGISIAVKAKICNLSIVRAGLQVLPSSPMRQEFNDFVARCIHVHTSMSASVAEDIWAVYLDSGYLALSGKTNAHFGELQSAFEVTTQKLRANPDVGYHVSWPSERGVEASVTNLRIYQRTHLGFQMAKRKGRSINGIPGKKMLQEIHWHLLEMSLASGLVDYWIGYVQEETRFSNLLFCAFQELHRNHELECVIPFQPLEIACAEMPAFATDTQIGTATDAELRMLEAHIKRVRPRPYWESHDFTRERFGLTLLKEEWQQASLTRDRTVLVARRNGRAQAFAILDMAEDGLHLYNLVDQVHFFALTPEVEDLCLPLLAHARDWYVGHGKHKFHYFYESHAEPTIEGTWVKNLGRASICVIGMKLIPDLLEYLYEVLAWDPREYGSMLPPAPSEPSETAE